MDSIGAEVGQKMRSAIKAKLMELDCYVDDELPDYIMVMVANRRSRSQMNDDLNLFLSNKTSTFVNWLHIVLKKLKEVTVTNPDVYSKTTKRKSTEEVNDDKNNLRIKKEKSNKKVKKELEATEQKPTVKECAPEKSLTDDLPLITSKFTDKRRIILSSENNLNNIVEDNFDIPLLSDVKETYKVKELEEVEEKINAVKSRLGILVNSDNEDDSFISSKKADVPRKVSIVDSEESLNSDYKEGLSERKNQHKRITFENDVSINSVNSASNSKISSDKRPSVLNRLGKRSGSPLSTSEQRKKVSLVEYRRDEEKYIGSTNKNNSRSIGGSSSSRGERSLHKVRRKESRKEGVLGRLGVQSKVAVIRKTETMKSEESDDDGEEAMVVREVQSLIKVKPRVIPTDAPQPNKNLLLKAVAEAQRSIAQTPIVGNNVKPDALFTKKYKEKIDKSDTNIRKIDEKEKSKLKALMQQSSSRMTSKMHTTSDEYNSEGEYIPKPVKNIDRDLLNYVPSSTHGDQAVVDRANSETTKQQFIITLDGIEKDKKLSAKLRLEGRRTPSPIVFDQCDSVSAAPSRSDIPDKLPIVHPPLSVKNKERCKYWPNCRQGDKCEFVHPTQNCEAFPNCKFGDRCLFLHPKCKFGNSCTKRDCPYDHNKLLSNAKSNVASTTLQNCRFFPNCTNPSCPFYHPKPCKYGKYCKNIECNFSHSFTLNKNKSLSWKSK
ncbi:nuclear polyadenosine RNA-binding 2 isoform X1 [Rhynchophorus ferrugineus]|uniref:nuclear polyadenosine RNA-binding 2 isoform X1 n=1 Tax=Rhynchophorus ferrugineus TaxID=354439 RepID=UPI003FCE3DFE